MIRPEIISNHEILTSVKQELRLTDTTEHDIFLSNLIDRAARRLSTTESIVIKNCTVTADNNKFELPQDGKRLVAFRGDGQCISGILLDTDFFASCNCKASGVFSNIYTAITPSDRTMYFLQTVADGAVFEIAYTAVNRGDDGLMKISEEQEEACIAYACWKFSLAYKQFGYDSTQVGDWKRDWKGQSDKSRSLAARRTFMTQRTQIRSTMNAIIKFEEPFNWFSSLFPTTFWYTNTP
jgi:hypothetical protein